MKKPIRLLLFLVLSVVLFSIHVEICQNSELDPDLLQVTWEQPYQGLAEQIGDSLTMEVYRVIHAYEYPVLLESIIWVESRWDPDAVSYKGAIGLMQVMEVAGLWVSDSLMARGIVDTPLQAQDLYDPVINVHAGIEILHRHMQHFANNPAQVPWALTSYNFGRKGAYRHGNPFTGYAVAVMDKFDS